MKFNHYKNLYSETYYIKCDVMSDHGEIQIAVLGPNYFEVLYTDGYNIDMIANCQTLESAKKYAEAHFNSMQKLPELLGNI